MKFKGTIIITSPEFIVKDNYSHPKPEDFNLPKNIDKKPYKGYEIPDELAYKAALDEYHKKNDRLRSTFGMNMDILGIHNYITAKTTHGFYKGAVYEITEDSYNNFIEVYEKGEDYETHYSKLGDFYTCLGLVSVFNLDEVRKYNPDIDEWIASHDRCVTAISDFDGEVNLRIDKQFSIHIVGIGNVNFFTD